MSFNRRHRSNRPGKAGAESHRLSLFQRACISLAATALLATLGLIQVRSAESVPPPAPDPAPKPAAASPEADDLRSPDAFASIEDDAERSRALFEEMGLVLTHPRCMNCHPAGNRPFQGDDSVPHEPKVKRGKDGFGSFALKCSSCHGDENFDPGKIPGAPHWHLAPIEMAWEGLSVAEICEQIKDPVRNGGRDIDAIVTHLSTDPLVTWGWNPGAGREPVPGTLETFSALVRAWAETGAECP